METRYQFDEDKIVFEVLDQEVMLVHLDSGYYYSLEGSAADMWQQLSAGATVPEAAQALLQRYDGPPADVEAAARDFLAQLLAEALLQPAAAGAIHAAPPAMPGPAGARPAFAPPVMYRYTDMANLIQMDPIRDFDETNWPRRRDAQP